MSVHCVYIAYYLLSVQKLSLFRSRIKNLINLILLLIYRYSSSNFENNKNSKNFCDVKNFSNFVTLNFHPLNKKKLHKLYLDLIFHFYIFSKNFIKHSNKKVKNYALKS